MPDPIPSTPFCARDKHLFAEGRKRILSLDGGGVRGVVSLAFLERIEAAIDEIEGRPTRLCDWFDLIGGTSTGAIIATALALGYRVADVRAMYDEIGPKVFKRSRFRVAGWQAKFDARALVTELTRILGERRLDSEDLQTGLCLVLKRMDTGSSWILANNPRSQFWDTPPDGSFIGNRQLPLVNLVRASTAAPTFFDPEPIEISPNMPMGLFLDGGLTSHNNPSLMLILQALLPAYGLNWKSGPDNLLVVSVGTGSYRPTMSVEQALGASALTLGFRSLAAMVAEGQALTLALMSLLGETELCWPINSEVGDLGPVSPPGGKWFRFARFDIRLERAWLARELQSDMSDDEIARLRPMDEPKNMPILYNFAAAAAAMQVKREHLKFGA